MNFNLPQLLKALLDQKGSDLHISGNAPPRFRIDGALLPLDVPALTPQDCMTLCYSILTDDQAKYLEENFEIDLAFSVKDLARFRANIFMQRGSLAGSFRGIANEMPGLRELNLPPLVESLCNLPHGLVLVTGPTGSGKSTTLGAMINYINETHAKHIVTIEDPVEIYHPNKKSLVRQRELGSDTKSFGRALKSVLRQDPDVILIGELRDLETISLALTAAETGHLVFATLHTNSSVSTLNRLIDVFPSGQQNQIRSQIAATMQAILSQRLLPALGGGRVMGMEVLVSTSGIKNLIRDDKFNQIYAAMQSGQDATGMQTFNQALVKLIELGKISTRTALEISNEIKELEQLLEARTIAKNAGKPKK
jgi:twitching motility protein PilT